MKRLVIGSMFILIYCIFTLFSIPTYAFSKNSSSSNTAINFASRFQHAVKIWNLKFIGKHLAYPVPIYLLGSSKDKLYSSLIATSKQGYITWMTPYLYKLIEETPPEKLVKMLDIRKDSSGKYLIHNLRYTSNPRDHKYSKYSIDSDMVLYHILDVLRKGATEHCAKCVAKVIEFPLTKCIGGRWIKIRNAAQFIKHYDQIVTPEVKDLMLHAWERHNWTGFPEQGIMLGSVGDIWIGSFGHKNAQGFYVWETKVTTLLEVAPPGCPIQ